MDTALQIVFQASTLQGTTPGSTSSCAASATPSSMSSTNFDLTQFLVRILLRSLQYGHRPLLPPLVLLLFSGLTLYSGFSKHKDIFQYSNHFLFRLVRNRLGDAGDHLSLVKRIESKWYRLSRKTKLCWEQAAEVLLESARVGRSMFASAMERDISCTPGCPGEQWPGPLDFCDADEIHGTELELEPVKLEAESEIDKDNFPPADPDPKLEQNKEEETRLSDDAPKEAEEHVEVFVETVVKKPGKRLGYLNIARNKKGRWEGPKTEVKSFQCNTCDFTTVTEWKLKRHEASSKHMNRLEELKASNDTRPVAAEENSNRTKPPEDPGGLNDRALDGFNWDHSYGTIGAVSTDETSMTKDEGFVHNQQA